jgi:hypothetical protein
MHVSLSSCFFSYKIIVFITRLNQEDHNILVEKICEDDDDNNNNNNN